MTHFDLENPADLGRVADPMLALSRLRGLVVLDETARKGSAATPPLDHHGCAMKIRCLHSNFPVRDRPGATSRTALADPALNELIVVGCAPETDRLCRSDRVRCGGHPAHASSTRRSLVCPLPPLRGRRRAGGGVRRRGARAAAVEAELQGNVRDAILAIGEPYAEVLRLHLDEELGPRAIALRLGRRDATVRTQLVRGIDRLCRRLATSVAVAVAVAVHLPASMAARRTEVLAAALRRGATATATGVGACPRLFRQGRAHHRRPGAQAGPRENTVPPDSQSRSGRAVACHRAALRRRNLDKKTSVCFVAAMASPAVKLQHLMASGQLWVSTARSGEASSVGPSAAWGHAEVAGRLIELGAAGPSAAWTAAVALVLDAQCLAEPVAWVTRPGTTFYPPDVAGNGVDLGGLAVVVVPSPQAVLRAADCLLRSGAFGLVVLDLGAGLGGGGLGGAGVEVPLPVQVRLAGLAKRHDAALCVLQDLEGKGPLALASLRAVSTRARVGAGRFACSLEVVKDKRRGREWECAQVLRGPLGLR